MIAQPLKILMVEDNRGDALLLRETLLTVEPGAFELNEVDRAEEALDRLKTNQFDAILLDLQLPDSQGLATFELVQGMAKEIPLIIMTGVEDEELAVRAIRQGAQDYLVKGTADGRGIARAIRYAVDRKKSQEALRESDRRLRLALDAADAGIWEWDLQTNINWWSEELWGLYGLKPNSCEPSYEAWLQTVHPDDRSKTDHILREAARKGINLYAEWRVCGRNGTVRWLMSRGQPLRDLSGKVVGMVGIVIDITKRKRTEKVLVSMMAEKAASDVVAVMEEGVVLLNMAGTIISMNPAMERITGYRAAEVVSRNIASFFPAMFFADELQKASEKLRDLSHGKPVALVPFTLKSKDEREVSVVPSAAFIYNTDGKPRSIVITLRDITQRLQIEKERERLAAKVIEIQEEERKSISSMLHDHAGQLLTLARLDLERLRPKDDRSRRIIRDVLQWLSEVITTIRDMAVSLRPPLLDNLHVEAALESLINDFSKGSKVKFTIKHEKMIPKLDVDKKTCLYRVLQEALTNSIKHSGASQVDVVLGTESKTIWIEIMDNGKGFDVEAGGRGNGIGLVNMRERVRQCGGTFNVNSIAGRGSIIRAVIPITKASE